ncbi:hypothetical protein BDM02DRAFT_3193663 [Thelephora ganbajun]|uniref:Uncharacterized protein n=1 Tax=Thelephora ganbajun TaxID=370292 RepID=A0ACB6YXV1_THEGA|nr:hypothetical protein BDM02DRAFT_3193663 [Thelephora ganbajun]
MGEHLWSLLERQQAMINQAERLCYRAMSDNRILSEKVIRLEAQLDRMKVNSPGVDDHHCSPSVIERFNSLVGSLIETVIESKGTDSSTGCPELKASSLIEDPIVPRSAWVGLYIDVLLASLEGRKCRQQEWLQCALEVKASKHPVTPPVDAVLESVVVIPSEFDTYDVHGLYNEVVPHSTIRVDDTTDQFSRDILEMVEEDDGDPDWADK